MAKYKFNVPNIFLYFKETPFVLKEFFLEFLHYCLHKFIDLVYLSHHIAIKQIEMIFIFKFLTLSKMIWSRGRIANLFRYVFVLIFVSTIFFAGNVFQRQLVDDKQNSFLEFVSGQNSIVLAQATAATYSSQTEILDGPKEHTVIDGETLIGLGQRYGISIESIKYANNLTTNSIKPGQILTIPRIEGTVHTVEKIGSRIETIEDLSRKFNVPSQTIVDFNYLDAPYTLAVGQSINIPKAKISDTKKYYVSNSMYATDAYGIIPYAKDAQKGTGKLIWPFSGILTQLFSPFHPAIDIASNSGDIVAADKGTIIRAGWWQGGYGNAVQIDHGNGYVTTYAHMSVISVSAGDLVSQGQKIGVVGSTGRSTGPHVHFTVQQEGKYLDPLSVL